MRPDMVLTLASSVIGATLWLLARSSCVQVSGPFTNWRPTTDPRQSIPRRSAGPCRSAGLRMIERDGLGLLLATASWGIAAAASARPASSLQLDGVLLIMPAITVAAASDMETMTVPDSVWAGVLAGWFLLRQLAYFPGPASMSVLTTALCCWAVTALHRPEWGGVVGGADIAALLTSSLFLTGRQLARAVWGSCVVALASSLGTRAGPIPYLPYYLCSVCLVNRF